MLLDIDYKEKKKYSKKQQELLNDTWLELYDEYFVLTDDAKSKNKMDETYNELSLRSKINQIKDNYDFLISLRQQIGLLPNEYINDYEQKTYNRLKLIDKRIKPLYFDGIDVNLKNLDKVLKSLINRYNIEHKQNNQEIQKEIQNVYDVVANAESWLDGRFLPIDQIVVTRWVSYQKQIRQKQKAQKKNGK